MSQKSEIPWIEKYRPKSLKDMIGFQPYIDQLRKFVDTFTQAKKQVKVLRDQLAFSEDPIQKKNLDIQLRGAIMNMEKNRARMLMGPPGVGKTTVVYALANDLNYSVIELNASDVRTEDAINSKLRETVKSNNLLSFTQQKSAGKIILIDEVDGISGQSDRGGVAALEKIITTTQFPIIMTCNFRDDQKFGGLYKLASPVIELETTKVQFIHQLLRRICTEEQLDISDDQLKKLIESSGGDFRSSINDLQALAQGNKSIDDDALSSINMHRDTVTNIQEFMRKLFSAPTIRAAKDVLDDVQQEDVDYNNLHKWINENMLNYIIKISDIRYACENLALADHILGYIGRLQDYGHLPYYFDLLAGGVRFAKSDLEFIKSKVEHPRYFRLRATPDDEVSLKLQHLFRVSLNDVVKQLGPTLDQFKDSDGLIRQYLNEKTNIVEKEAKGVKEDKDSDDE